MPRAALLVSWLAISLSPTTASAGACAQPPPVYQVLTATDVEISGGGGIVAQIDNLAKPPAWRFEGQKADVSVKPIAPGLGTIELPKANRWVTLADSDKKKLVRVRAGKTDAPIPHAPEVTALERSQRTGRRGTSVSIDATVKVVPPNAIALVVFGTGKTGRVGRSWARVTSAAGLSTGPHASIAIQVFHSGSCDSVPVGWTDSYDGDKVELAWLDSSGRLSKTIAVTVKSTP